MQIQSEIDYINQSILKLEQKKNWLIYFQTTIESLEVTACSLSAWGDGFDFNNPTRKEVLALIQTFPGKWMKSKSYGAMHYSLIEPSSEFWNDKPFVPLRLWSVELPPTCTTRIVKRIIPATPEHEVEETEIVCQLPITEGLTPVEYHTI